MTLKNTLKIIVVCILLTTIIGVSSADVNKFFTPFFNYNETDIDGVDYSHYNTSVGFSTVDAIPNDVFIALIFATLAMLVIAYRFNDDLCGILSAIFSAIVTISSRCVDYVDGYGVTSQVAIQAATGKINTHEYVLMTHHVIYPINYITVLFAIVFILSVINVYRIYILNSKIDGVGG